MSFQMAAFGVGLFRRVLRYIFPLRKSGAMNFAYSIEDRTCVNNDNLGQPQKYHRRNLKYHQIQVH